MTKIFDPDARVGHGLALSIFLAALAGCGGKVIDDRSSDGGRDGAIADSAVVDSFEPVDSFLPPERDSASFDTGSADDCMTCVTTRCAKEYDACVSDVNCPSVVNCVNDCADEACANACLASDKPGAALASDIYTCVGDKCADLCF